MTIDLDHCPPPCGKRITDYDMSGIETPTGQRYCLVHMPACSVPAFVTDDDGVFVFVGLCEREPGHPGAHRHTEFNGSLWEWDHARPCEWFALCTNEATQYRTHPVLGDVPICDRCAAKLETEVQS